MSELHPYGDNGPPPEIVDLQQQLGPLLDECYHKAVSQGLTDIVLVVTMTDEGETVRAEVDTWDRPIFQAKALETFGAGDEMAEALSKPFVNGLWVIVLTVEGKAHLWGLTEPVPAKLPS